MYEPTELEWAIAARVGMGHPAIGPLTLEQQRDEDGLNAYHEAMERMCGSGFSTGGFDPYGTSCELDAGHTGPHRGHDPFGNGGHVTWEGGGMCAGDPLPVRNVEWHAKEES